MAKPTTKPKKADVRLDILTVTGNSCKTDIFYRHPTGSFHVFMETESRQAAVDCGAPRGHSRKQCEWVWNSRGGA